MKDASAAMTETMEAFIFHSRVSFRGCLKIANGLVATDSSEWKGWWSWMMVGGGSESLSEMGP